MKKISVLAALLMQLTSHSFSLSLSEAIATKKVSVDWTGADWNAMPPSIHNSGYAPKMQLVIKNQTASPLSLDLEEGYLLQPDLPGYQAMLITQKINLNCPPNQKQQQFIYTMCTQLSHSGPGCNTHYKLGKKASGALLHLAQFIRIKGYQNVTAQEAVWSITNDSPILSINSSNPAIEMNFQKLVAQLKGVDLEKLKQSETRKASAILAEYNGIRTDRNITFSSDSMTAVSVGYYDANNELITPLFTNRNFTKGKHSIRYNPYPISIHNKNYSVKMIRDSQVFKEYYFRQ